MIVPLDVGIVVVFAAASVVSYARSERTRPDALFSIGVFITAAGLAAHAWMTTQWTAALAFLGGTLALAVSFAELGVATEMDCR